MHTCKRRMSFSRVIRECVRVCEHVDKRHSRCQRILLCSYRARAEKSLATDSLIIAANRSWHKQGKEGRAASSRGRPITRNLKSDLSRRYQLPFKSMCTFKASPLANTVKLTSWYLVTGVLIGGALCYFHISVQTHSPTAGQYVFLLVINIVFSSMTKYVPLKCPWADILAH